MFRFSTAAAATAIKSLRDKARLGWMRHGRSRRRILGDRPFIAHRLYRMFSNLLSFARGVSRAGEMAVRTLHGKRELRSTYHTTVD